MMTATGPETSTDLATKLITTLDRIIPRYTRSIRTAIELAEGDDRITMPQVRCIQMIDRQGGQSLTTTLARKLGVTAPTMTRMLDGLAERGVIERRPDPASRRQILIVLTDEGRELLDRCNAVIADRIRTLLVHLDEAQQERLLAAIADLGAALTAEKPVMSESETAS
jgi:DNA-binding MarR family transcriptional regulator